MKKSTIIVPVLTTVVGLSFGYAVGMQNIAPPEIVTKTVTEIETVEVTPASCTEALDFARGIADNASGVMGLLGEYPDMVQAAATAGFNQSSTEIDAVVATMNANTEKLGGLGDELTPLVDGFISTSDECDASATEGGV